MSALKVTRRDGVVQIALDRPAKGNALDRNLSTELLETVSDQSLHDQILVFTGSTPGTFVAGADIEELRTRTVADNLRLLNARLFEAIEEHPCPTVAVVDGPALGGGCELALSCDVRLATPRSVWGLPEVRLGLVPAAGGLYRLGRLVGHGLATDLILTGRRVDGREAQRIGLCQRLSETEDLDSEVDALIGELTRPSRFAQQLAKKVIRGDHNGSRVADALAQALCILDSDTQRRLASFLEHSAAR